ncbi:MAG: HD domain-containing protein, partial [Bacteroidales bacterium]|nr:HD domain-containing protein [Bacteroidales bacterium]
MDKNTDITRQKIYLAALLHDIGKFYQRASNNRNQEGNN